MYSKFLEGMTGKVATQWATNLLTPAFLFWAGGFVAFISCQDDWALFISCQDRWVFLNTWVLSQSQSVQVGLLIGGLIIIATSAALVQNCDLATLRFLEGYWPRWMRLLQTWRINCLHFSTRPRDRQMEPTLQPVPARSNPPHPCPTARLRPVRLATCPYPHPSPTSSCRPSSATS